MLVQYFLLDLNLKLSEVFTITRLQVTKKNMNLSASLVDTTIIVNENLVSCNKPQTEKENCF